MTETEKERPDHMTLHYGEVGVIALALLFLFGFLFLMFSPSPLKGLDKFDAVANRVRAENVAKADKAMRQRDIDAAEATGVVTVGIAPAKKH